MDNDECVGAIVCKLDRYKDLMRGYIAMLDVKSECRRKQIGKYYIMRVYCNYFIISTIYNEGLW